MDLKFIFDYLNKLENNNNRDWYHENGDLNVRARDEFLKVLQSLIYRFGETDKELLFLNPKDLTYRIPKDMRFSKDEYPYNPAMRAHIARGGKEWYPAGFYIELRTNNRSFVSAGIYFDGMKEVTTRIRDYIEKYPEKWLGVVENAEFKSKYPVQGTQLKNVPAGYDKFCIAADYLKNKSFWISRNITDEEILGGNFVELMNKYFLEMKPFIDLINKALEGFAMPEKPARLDKKKA